MADSPWRRALSKCSDLRYKVVANIIAGAVTPQITADPEGLAAPGVAPALPHQELIRKKGKPPFPLVMQKGHGPRLLNLPYP